MTNKSEKEDQNLEKKGDNSENCAVELSKNKKKKLKVERNKKNKKQISDNDEKVTNDKHIVTKSQVTHGRSAKICNSKDKKSSVAKPKFTKKKPSKRGSNKCDFTEKNAKKEKKGKKKPKKECSFCKKTFYDR